MQISSTFRLFLLASIFIMCWATAVWSQNSVYNQRDDQYRLLGLKRAKEAYELARAEFEQKQQLFDRKLITKLELDRSRSQLADAEVNYQQSMLAVLFEKQHVAVAGATKYQAKDGRKLVRLRLENTSGGTAEFRKLANLDSELFNTLQPDVINDVYVSLLNDDNAIISLPYEAKIEELHFGKPAVVDFALLQDLDAVKVQVTYGSGSERTAKIYLQKDASVDKVAVQAEQFSQEKELGSSATFELTLELFSGATNTFKLEVANLPAQINRYFSDPTTQARLSQFRFTGSTDTRRVALQVYLPDRPSDEIAIDKPIAFYVLVIPAAAAENFGDLRAKQWTQTEIEALKLGYARLELIPRGLGRLLVRARQLFHAIKPDETVSMNLELVNEGTRRLDNVVVNVDLPLNWSKSIDRPVLPALEIGEEQSTQLSFTPPQEVAAGRYEIRIRTTSLSDGQPITGEDKTVTVEIQSEANLFGVTTVVLLILGVVVGMVIFGIRISRR